METSNKYITVTYKLYTVEEEGGRDLVEEATANHPFNFITGLGAALDIFEKQIKDLHKGDKFEFTIPYADAYGEYDEEHVIDLPKNMFEVDGHFDEEAISEGKMIPLLNADGQRLNGIVAEVQSDIVVMDLNHPLAGEDLIFAGEVIENRPATNEEIQEMIHSISGDGCGCGGCGGDCGSGCDCESAGSCHG